MSDVTHKIERLDEPVLSVQSERVFEGVVFVADMAGYTQFTERMVSSAHDGVERLGRSLERSFRGYVGLITSAGGTIASFAGDAVIAYWPFAGADPREITWRALQCASRLLTRAQDVLPLHAGLAIGPIWSGACAGFANERDAVLGGPATRRACAAAKAAHAGELKTTGAVLRLLEPDAAADDADLIDAAPLLAAEPLARPELTSYLPDSDLWNAELRSVAASFLRFRAFDEQRPGQWSAYRHALLLAQETVGTSGATGRLVIDDGGLVFVAVLGEPGAGKLDPSDILVRRMADIVHKLDGLGYDTAAGLAFGNVYCGEIRHLAQRWKVSIGRALNVAARLMDRAQRGVLLAELPHPSSSTTVSEHEEPHRLRGISGPVLATRIERAPELVVFGREAELSQIAGLLDHLARGRGGACLIRADAGVGKSALLSAAQARIMQSRLSFVRGEALASESAVPFFAWRRVLRDLLAAVSVKDARASNALIEHLRQLGLNPGLAPLLNNVLHAELPESDVTEHLSGRARAEAVLELSFALIKHAAERPLVIVIEDVHFADPASLELIERVAHRMPSVLLLLTARPAALTSDLIYRLSSEHYHQLDLPPLSRSGVEALLSHRLGGPVAPSLVECIDQASAGNALFALEYLRLLQERHGVSNDNGTFRLVATLESLRAPDNVIGAVSSRIHCLPEAEQQVLKLASVLGDSFSREMLQLLVRGEDPDGLHAALTHLERSGLIVQQSLLDDAIVFSHALIRDAAYGALLHEQRRHMHSSVARILEHRREHELRTTLPMLVHHYAAAGDDARTLKYGEEAALEAMKQGAYQNAIQYLQMCLHASTRVSALKHEPRPLIRWHRLLSEAAGALGDLAARRDHALRSLQLAAVRVTRRPWLARVGTITRLLVRLGGRRPRLQADARRKSTAAEHVEVAQAFNELAYAHYFAGEGDWFVYCSLRALSHAERGGDVSQLVQMIGSVGAVMGYLGLDRLGRRYIAAARKLGESQGHEQACATADMASALYLVGRGAWADALFHVEHCQRTCERLGSNYLWGNAQIIRFWLLWYKGERAAAADAVQHLLENAERSGNRQHLCWAHRSLGLVHRSRGELETARYHMELARALLNPDADLNEAVQVLGCSAELQLALGHANEAEALAIHTLERLSHAPRMTGHAVLEGCSALTRVLFHAWSVAPHDHVRRGRARDALRVLKRYASVFPIGRPRYLQWRARFLQQLGRQRAAQAASERSQQWMARMELAGDPLEIKDGKARGSG